jgi:hypothetical protein
MKKATAKKSTTRKSAKVDSDGDSQITAWSTAQPAAARAICDALRELITKALSGTTAKVWHGSPVWFCDENPVVGYSVKGKSVSLLFWNGQALDEPDLKPVGKYHAAEALFGDASEIDAQVVRRWLKKAGANVFDSQAFFKQRREGK